MKREFTPQYQIKSNPMLDKDFYKEFHGRCLPSGMTKSVSYFTPRKSRVDMWPEVVVHGYQAFIKQHLIDGWNRDFFCRPKDEVVEEYARIIENTMGQCDRERVAKLHNLGYLPIEIYALPEGTLCPMHVPFFAITNTNPDFAWLPQALESLISAELWYPMITATVGHTYRQIVNKYYDMTCDDDVPRKFALGNFDYRGDTGSDAALKAASGWLLSFANTATVMSIPYMEAMYRADCTKELVGRGANSTEHFVMCSNSAEDILNNPDYEYADIDPRRERVFLKRLLTEICPNENVSCVCDSYDYWNVVENILPTLKDEILNHNGTFLVRGDSGDCVEVVTKTVFKLWEIFGGTYNSKGYKVLDPHVKALYGDSIQIETAERIYKILEDAGFAAQNVSLGVGSFSMHCVIENGQFKPFTRDTFSSAIKACNATINGRELAIYKDPKTDRETGDGFKKSQKGCSRVFMKDGVITYQDELTFEESLNDTLMIKVFEDSVLVEDQKLSDIRARLNNNNF